MVIIKIMKPDCHKAHACIIKRGMRGMALLELVIATAILGTALILIGMGAGYCIQGLTIANNIQTATEIAEERMEQWKAGIAADQDIKATASKGDHTVNGRLFSWQQQVESTDNVKIFKSTLTVQWKEGASEREYVFTTLAATHVRTQDGGTTE